MKKNIARRRLAVNRGNMTLCPRGEGVGREDIIIKRKPGGKRGHNNPPP